MKRLLTTLAICTAAVVMLSDDSQASEIQTAYYQPRPGGVIDVITSPFRALTQPVSYRTAQQTYRPYYGQASYGSTNCVNGVCYPTSNYSSNYASPCASGNCGAGMSCPGGNCGTGYGMSNCPGGNCNLTQYRYPTQNYSGYRGTGWNSMQQYPAYRPVAQPVYRTSVPASTNSIRNDPFFP